eukprot:TRINITY_DN1161_c0_g5_i1.p1 TRINITY_DN1161_c0_g5~~TRINITY_DN1161_c0_g5_i1.p1  ORF type:complete len:392 (+),score=72.34 TRINITY_DN1161_c0_g5_i1:140-1315(+)
MSASELSPWAISAIQVSEEVESLTQLEEFCSYNGDWNDTEVASALSPFRHECDYYNEPDDTVRGVTIDYHLGVGSDPIEKLIRDEDGDRFDDEPICLLQLPMEIDDVSIEEKQDTTAKYEKEALSDLVEPAVKDISYASHTDIFLKADSIPASVLRESLTFLNTEVSSEVAKVNNKKLSIKAHVYQEVGYFKAHCLVKLRVFHLQAPGSPHKQVLVECSKRRGDSVAFTKVQSNLKKYLYRKFAPANRDGMAHPKAPAAGSLDGEGHLNTLPLPPLPNEVESVTPAELTPLLFGSSTAEAVSALAAVASASTAGAVAVCAALREFSKWSDIPAFCHESYDPEVSLPATSLISSLRTHCGVEAEEVVEALESYTLDFHAKRAVFNQVTVDVH